jgi:hypothetical protein
MQATQLPSVQSILDPNVEYRKQAATHKAKNIASKKFNPEGKA